jgi:hypothetical protein
VVGQHGQGVTHLENAHQVDSIFFRARCAELRHKTAALAVVYILEAGFKRQRYRILQLSRRDLRFGVVTGAQRRKRGGFELGDVVGREIAFDKRPDCLQRVARQAAGVPPGRNVINQERLKQLEEEPRRRLATRRPLTGFAHHLAQFGQDEICRSVLLAAQHPALEFSDQFRSRFACQTAQKLTQPVDGRAAAPHSIVQLHASSGRNAWGVNRLLSISGRYATGVQLPSGLRQATPRAVCGVPST